MSQCSHGLEVPTYDTYFLKAWVGLHAGAYAVIFIGIGQCTSSGSGSRDQFIEQIETSLSLAIVVLYSWLLGAIADGVSFSTIFHLIDI